MITYHEIRTRKSQNRKKKALESLYMSNMDTLLKTCALKTLMKSKKPIYPEVVKRAMVISKDYYAMSNPNVIVIVNVDIDAIALLTFYWS